MKRVVRNLYWLVAPAVVLMAATAGAQTDTRLADAVKAQNTALARALIQQRAGINATQPDGSTALHWAAQWNDLSTAELLLKAGAHVNAGNDYGVTPLSLAALNGSAPVVERLLGAGADPNIGMATGETPLMTAARAGSVTVVRALAQRGANLEAKESFRGQTALMWALSENHLDTATALIEAGADVSARATSGFTPLMFVAREGSLDAARLLLSRGADVNDASKDGSTALLVATVRGHAPLALMLLDRGANPNLGPGYAPLHWVSGKWESIFTFDYPWSLGEWSRLVGVQEGRTDLLKALLKHGANVNARTTSAPPRFGHSVFAQGRGGTVLVGVTPFYLAATVGDPETMRLLIASGADPEIPAADGTTPLIVASGRTRLEQESHQPESGFLEAARLCVSLGLDVNARNDLGETPLHGAAISGLDSIVQFLFDRGAEVNARDKRGLSPLDRSLHYEIAATVFEHPTTAALLRKMGAKD